MEKRLFRNENDKVIAGVSSGLADYMEVDVTIIRLLFVLSSFFLMGTGVLVYLILWIVVPVNYNPVNRFTQFNDYFKQNPSTGPNWTSTSFNESSTGFTGDTAGQPFGSQAGPSTGTSAGQGFNTRPQPDFNATRDADYGFMKKNNGTGRTVGGLFLLVIGIYFLMNEFHIIPYWFSISKLWPLIFVAIGISFIAKSKRKDAWEDWKQQQDAQAGQQTTPPNAGSTTESTNESNTTQL